VDIVDAGRRRTRKLLWSKRVPSLGVGNFGPNVRHVPDSDAPSFGPNVLAITGSETQQRTNLVQRESKLPRSQNKSEPRHIVAIVSAKPATFFPAWLRQQSNPLVVADRFDVAPGSRRSPLQEPHTFDGIGCGVAHPARDRLIGEALHVLQREFTSRMSGANLISHSMMIDQHLADPTIERRLG
jgi:hypothetical protein